jgi:hypothetical protein
MDGASYTWGTAYWGLTVGGSGTSGHYWLLVIQGFIGLSILALGWRGARPPFHPLLLLWHAVLATSAVYSAFTHPDQYRFRGDTMGIDISLAWVGPLLFGGFFLLALVWTARDLRRGHRPPVSAWTKTNTAWLAILLCMLPVQFALLRFGEPHGRTDQLGVVLTIIQCCLLGRIFRPTARSAARGHV